MKTKTYSLIRAFMIFYTLLAVVYALIILYAEDHPNTKIHYKVESFGIYLRK